MALPTASSITDKLPRFLRRHKLMTCWMALTGEDPVQPVRIRDDIFALADMSDGFLRLIVIDKQYDEDFFALGDALLAGGGTFLDVGANFGLLSFGLAGKHGSTIDFHLFEPNIRLVNTIARSQKRFPQMRCKVNAVAVSDRPGTVNFHINEGQTGASHIAEEGGVEVQVVTLDDYIAAAALADVTLLKLDVEGFELNALRGAERSLRERTINAVYFEYFEKYLIRAGPPQQVIDFLDSVGFATTFCRSCDYDPHGGPTHTLAGTGVRLLPVGDFARPPMTDLLAVPRDHLVPVAT